MKQPIQLKLPPAMLERLAKIAKKKNTSKTQLVEEGIALILDKYEKLIGEEEGEAK